LVLPPWLAVTVHVPVLLVIVMVALLVAEPVLHAVPDHDRATAKPELAVAATGKLVRLAALDGALVVNVMVCAAAVMVTFAGVELRAL